MATVYSPTYRERSVLQPGMVGEPRLGPEEAVVRLWQNADRLASGLVTQDGRRLKVLYPGRRSSSAGPDFRDCVLSTESGDIVVGDVEVHVTEGGWSAHGHHVDSNYNSVVLHVVLRPNGRATTTLESRAEAPVAAIGVASRHVEAEPEPKRSTEAELTVSALQARVDRAGDDRFRSKADGYRMELETGDAEQVLYAGIMDALGYSENRRPFVALAHRVPIARLRALRSEPHATRLLAIQAMLVSASGLMSSASQADEERFRAVLKGLPVVEKIDEPWKVFRVRPTNHPLRRIEGAAVLIDRALDEGLVSVLARTVRRGTHRPVIDLLSVPPFIGESRAREIAVNVVLPFMYTWGGITRDRELRSWSMELFRKMPGLADNEITREMKRLLPSGVETRGARRQQGLIHLYRHMRGTGWLEQVTAHSSPCLSGGGN
ncbi:MAG: DUF2851 family protein [Chloroflexi bacterium]|nr:DUF2851 family protein [Chloroflexota bacterium]